MWKRAQVHLQTIESILNAGLVGAFAECVVRSGMLNETFQRFGSTGSGDEKIEIADGFLAAPEAARGGDLFDAAGLGKIRDQLARDAMTVIQQEPAGTP